MKMFTKLALVSSMAISANAMAMQSMDDAALSAATGQDGITMVIDTTSNITIDQLFIHDNDGLDGGGNGITTAGAGAIVIGDGGATPGVTIAKQTAADKLLTLDIDSDSTDGGVLNIGASVAALDITVGAIGVGASNGSALTDTTTVVRGVSGTNEILTGLTLSLGAITANVQLGATPQGAMIKIDSELTGGITISDLGLKDNGTNGGGEIYLDNIYVRGATNGNIDVDTDINVTTSGLEIKNNSTEKMNVYLEGVHLGAAANASIGDVEVRGIYTGGSTITITGH